MRLVGEPEGSIETFIGVVVPHADLQFDRLLEFALLASAQHLVDGLLEELRVNLAH